MSLAAGMTFLTSSRALTIARFADSASRVNLNAIRPGWPMPIKASSQPASPRRSTNSSASASSVGSLNLNSNSYSIVQSLRGGSAFSPLTDYFQAHWLSTDNLLSSETRGCPGHRAQELGMELYVYT